MGRLTVATAPAVDAEFGAVVLDEDRVRDQLSAAEELLYVGHAGPAIVAAGVALEGAARVSAGAVAGETASWGALLEALLAMRLIDAGEQELLHRVLSARDRLAHGYMPEPADALAGPEVLAVIDIVIRLLESCAIGPLADSPGAHPSLP